MATTTGQSSKTSGGGYIESRLTYTVSNNVATITKLEVRKRPSTLSEPTSGTWKYEIGYNWDNAKKSGSIHKSVGTSWVTLWSSTVKVDITKNGGSDNVIYGTVTAPTGTTYAGLSARAAIKIEYEEPEPDPDPKPDPDPEPSYTYTVTIQHYYGDTLLNTDYEYDVIEGSLYYLEDCARTYTDYAYSHGTVDGVTLIQTRIYEDTTIKLYYTKLNKWTVYDKDNLGGEFGGNFNFSQYQIFRWYYTATEDGKLKFYTTGSADTIGWISLNRDWSVNDKGVPNEGYYTVMDDDSGNNHNFSLTYDIKKGESVYLYIAIYQGKSASNVTVNISLQKSKYKINMMYYIPDEDSTEKYSLIVHVYEISAGAFVKPENYIYPSEIESSYIFSHVVIRGTTTSASNISTVTYQINQDEDWEFYYRNNYWRWNAANRSTSDAATAEQTIAAHQAITNSGTTSSFNYRVWNDLCAVTLSVLTSKTYGWDTTYATYDNTLMSNKSKTLTALRFNSLRKNIDKLCKTNISEKTKYNGILLDSNRVIGSEFITLTDCLNRA